MSSNSFSLDTYLASLGDVIHGLHNNYQTIVDAPFRDKQAVTRLGLGIVVLLRVNPATSYIDRIALSVTHHAKGAVKVSAKPFEQIRIPKDDKNNIIAITIATGKPHSTNDWQYLFVPALTKEQARYNQSAAAIDYSVVHPLTCKPAGALIFSYYRETDKHQQEQFMTTYAKLVSRSLAN